MGTDNLRSFVPVLLIVASLASTGHRVALAQPSVGRPRVGLALGGGSARGLAHVGVLEWLEEHRIPVDAVAGTSIGALVGAAYASGRSAAEVAALVGDVDWDRLFGGEVEYAVKSFRRKEDRRGYPVRLELGLRDGLRGAPSLDQGHAVDLFLSRLALPFALPLRFDDLPIPFRAVATDLEAAAAVELAGGSLASALRATMAIPGVFQPVEREGLVLADGGLLDNVPADVVSRMGVDVVIAVDVSAPLGARDRLQSLVGVANQAIGVMMVERTRRVIGLYADHVVAPATEDVGSGDWRELETIRALGYEAAADVGGSLAYLALSPVEWEAHLEARRRRRASAAIEPTFVTVDAASEQGAEEIGGAVEPLLGRPLDPDALDRRLASVMGRGRYGSLGYDLLRDGDAIGIGVRVSDKPHGPPFVNLAIAVENHADAVELATGVRLTVLDAGARDAELRFDLMLGSDPEARLDYYLPRGGSPWFVAPRLELQNERQRYSLAGNTIASYRVRRELAGIDLGRTFGATGELRMGYEMAGFQARVRVGDPVLREYGGLEHGARVKWVHDGHDHWLTPSGGTRVETELRWFAAAPERPSGFIQARFGSTTFFRAAPAGRVFVPSPGARRCPTIRSRRSISPRWAARSASARSRPTGFARRAPRTRVPAIFTNWGGCRTWSAARFTRASGSSRAARSRRCGMPASTPACRQGCWWTPCSARSSPAPASAATVRPRTSWPWAGPSGNRRPANRHAQSSSGGIISQFVPPDRARGVRMPDPGTRRTGLAAPPVDVGRGTRSRAGRDPLGSRDAAPGRPPS